MPCIEYDYFVYVEYILLLSSITQKSVLKNCLNSIKAELILLINYFLSSLNSLRYIIYLHKTAGRTIRLRRLIWRLG